MKITGILAAILLAFAVYAIYTYNTIVSQLQNTQAAWAQVENVYQRRADLIPNLVATVKGYATHERETFTQVTEARSAVLQAQKSLINNQLPNAEQLKQIEAAQRTLSSALSRLLVTVERYPDLKANQNFLSLQAELAGTENRISVERYRFNQAAQAYNAYLLTFPRNLFAHFFGFQPAAYFVAKPGSDVVPKVDFTQ